MPIARNAYYCKINDELVIFDLIIIGFTRIIKNWWDLYLSKTNEVH